jgi:hypothetical protein
VELQGDHHALERAQERKTQDQGQGQPDHQVQPHRRMEGHLGEQRAEAYDEADDQDDEDGRAIAAVGLAQVEAAGLAFGGDGEETLE